LLPGRHRLRFPRGNVRKMVDHLLKNEQTFSTWWDTRRKRARGPLSQKEKSLRSAIPMFAGRVNNPRGHEKKDDLMKRENDRQTDFESQTRKRPRAERKGSSILPKKAAHWDPCAARLEMRLARSQKPRNSGSSSHLWEGLRYLGGSDPSGGKGGKRRPGRVA